MRKIRLGEEERGRLLRFARNDLQVIKLQLSWQKATSNQHQATSNYDKELLQNRPSEYQKKFDIFNSEYKRHGNRHGSCNPDFIMGTG